jgi:hypothetical protein
MSKKFLLSIDTGNAAFTDLMSDNPNHQADARRRECAAILKEAARQLEMGVDRTPLRDTNGNTVGNFRFTTR